MLGWWRLVARSRGPVSCFAEGAQIFIVVLAKQLGVRPDGWGRTPSGIREGGYQLVADLLDAASLRNRTGAREGRQDGGKAAQGG